ncbi:MAG: hypothetical protein QOI89_3912 [Solirubrobacteraceae bacterium]|nr:hypothetical protein [Solirubrobacteraceae bacterium]
MTGSGRVVSDVRSEAGLNIGRRLSSVPAQS